jgi:hypothetical protein
LIGIRNHGDLTDSYVSKEEEVPHALDLEKGFCFVFASVAGKGIVTDSGEAGAGETKRSSMVCSR